MSKTTKYEPRISDVEKYAQRYSLDSQEVFERPGLKRLLLDKINTDVYATTLENLVATCVPKKVVQEHYNAVVAGMNKS